MKRSRAVRLTLVASASASACAGPGASPQALHCVARGTNRVVADSLCDRARVAENGGRTGAFGTAVGSSGEFGGPGEAGTPTTDGARGLVGRPAYVPSFLWYYGGRVASGVASAGGFAPQDGASYRSPGGYATRAAAGRGFFGRMAARIGGAARGAGSRGAISRGGFGATGAAHGGGAHGG